MKKLLLASLTTLFLTACGGENTEQFLGSWIQQNDSEPSSLVITKESGDKVNVLHDRVITKTNTIFLVKGDKLIDPRSSQAKFVLENGLIVTASPVNPDKYKKQ